MELTAVIAAISGIVKALGIRGKTGHLSAEEAEPIGVQVGDSLTSWIQSKGATALERAINEYPERLFDLVTKGKWWASSISVNNWLLNVLRTQILPAPRDIGRLRYTAVVHAHWVARNVDAERFTDDFTSAYRATLNQTLGQVVVNELPPNINPTTGGGTTGGTVSGKDNTLLYAGIGLAGLLLFTTTKKKG
jgi:hypothetical protein